VVGLLLGRMLETQAIMSYELSGGSPAYILQRPGAIAILAVMALSIGMSAWSKHRQRRAAAIATSPPLGNTVLHPLHPQQSEVLPGAAH